MTNDVERSYVGLSRRWRGWWAGGLLIVAVATVATLQGVSVPADPVTPSSRQADTPVATPPTKGAGARDVTGADRTRGAGDTPADIVITGELQSLDAQPIYTPQANMSPVVLRYYVPEGTAVKRGDVVLRIDAGQSASQIRTLDAQIDQARARMAKELAELQVKVVDAELALVDAEATLANARIDAALPKGLISGLDYDRYQGEQERAVREGALKREELATARAAVARRQNDGGLEVRKLQVQRDYHAAQVAQAEVRADRDGVVLHGFNNNWIGGRIDEGSSTMPGGKAGEVVSGGAMRVRAWALEPDRRGLMVDQPVRLAFDAVPGRRLEGRITAIAGAPDRKQEWGEGRYFQVDVALQPPKDLKLLPGMSVQVTASASKSLRPEPQLQYVAQRVAVGGEAPTGKTGAPAAAASRPLRIDGEVFARETAALMPPSIDDLWQFNITTLAADGTPVKKGEPVLGFDSSELMKRLMEKQSVLKEKQTQLDKLVLELAERARNEALANAEAVSLREKAERKTQQPEALIAGVQYRKLVVERRKAEQRQALIKRRQGLAAEQRSQERRLIGSEVTQLQGEVAVIQRSLAALEIAAPRDGLMMHKSTWSGEKFDVGSQVWRGQGVAEIPDTRTLAVRAELPERDLAKVALGAPARVVVEGGAGSALRGKVTRIGRAVRSKSRVKPVPILDLEITLSEEGTKLRPGQPVSVELGVGAGA